MRAVFCVMVLWYVLGSQAARAQYYNQLPEFRKANSMWAFARNAGLNFNSDPPDPFYVQMNVFEGCASVAHPQTGELLFYTQGYNIWNRNNMIMAHGAGLLGNTVRSTTAQGACIVPMIDSPGKYYLFSLSNDGSYDSTGYLYYSIVDMSLNNGLGDVVPGRANIRIDSGLSESMIAIPGNNCDVWLMVHTYDTPTFKAHRITPAGIDPDPVVSVTGWQISGREAYHIGQMAVSPDRSRIGVTSYHYEYGLHNGTPLQPPGLNLLGALVCRFDPATGVVSDALQLERLACYGLGFSPDNSKLYVNVAFDPVISFGKINQYDVSVFDSAAIISSRQEIHRFDNPIGKECSFKLYGDTLYVGAVFNYKGIDRIVRPNLAGSACGYEMNAVRLRTNVNASYGLPNDVVYPFAPESISRRIDTVFCDNMDTLVLEAPPGYMSYRWDDGSDGLSRKVTETGLYRVSYKAGCHEYTDTIAVRSPDTLRIASDSFICISGGSATLNAPDEFLEHVWDDGSTMSSLQADRPGTYWVSSYAYCLRQVDTFHVTEADMRFSMGSDTVVCDDSVLVLEPSGLPEADRYFWSDGSSGTVLAVTETGVYALTAEKGTCRHSDSVEIRFVKVRQDLGSDTVVCRRTPFELVLRTDVHSGQSVRWNDGSSDRQLLVNKPGEYSVIVSEYSCTDTARITVSEKVCRCIAEIPTAFSPNGDGRNDLFRPVLEQGCDVFRFSLEVFNRWGALIYSGADVTEGWDGSIGSTPAEVGTYFYKMYMELGTEREQQRMYGEFTLIR